MTNEIRPALSAEEWGHAREYADEGRGADHFRAEAGPMAWIEPHKVAALALYGQPFGFTWEIHDAIMWAISDYESEAGFMDEHQQREHAAMLRGLAIIASLLPPREEG